MGSRAGDGCARVRRCYIRAMGGCTHEHEWAVNVRARTGPAMPGRLFANVTGLNGSGAAASCIIGAAVRMATPADGAANESGMVAIESDMSLRGKGE